MTMTTPIAAAALEGRSLLAGEPAAVSGTETFTAYDPTTGQALEPRFSSANLEDVDGAVRAASDASPALAQSSGADRARLLRRIAEALDAAAPALIDRAHLESGAAAPAANG